MKKIFYLIYFLSFGLHGQIRATLNGFIDGLENQTVYLIVPEAKIYDSLQSKAGKFTFHVTLKEPMMAKIKIQTSAKMVEVFLEGSAISLVSEFKKATGSFEHTRISGSIEHEVYKKLLGAEGGGLTPEELNQMREFLRVNDTISINQMKAKKSIEMEEAHKKMLLLFREHSSRYAAAYYIYSARIDSKQTRIRDRFYELYSLLDESIKQSYYAKNFIERFNKK